MTTPSRRAATSRSAAGLGLGIAAFGGALGQGKTAAAALEGIARNPGAQNKIFTPMILGLALIDVADIAQVEVTLVHRAQRLDKLVDGALNEAAEGVARELVGALRGQTR